MTLPHPIPEDLAELIARRFRAIGEPLRVRMLDLLREDELGVNELAERLGAGQQAHRGRGDSGTSFDRSRHSFTAPMSGLSP